MEVGAANLALTKEILGKFDKGLAVDLTDDLLESYNIIPRTLRTKLTVMNADITLQDNLGEFDCILACEVMEHLEDDRLFLQKLFSSLKPGGQVLISVPARQCFWSIHDELVGHLRRYEKGELIALAEECGFINVRVISYGFPWINLLSKVRISLARLTLKERATWDQRTQSTMSNHRQIPHWLQSSLVAALINKFTVYPFAVFSRLFNNRDWSDGYLVEMSRHD